MGDVKESKHAAGAEVIAGMQDFAPPTILAQASRLNFSARFYNLLVTNIPGPQFPLYVLGRRLEAVFPVAFLAGDRALAVAVMSYDGGLGFGLIADLDALPRPRRGRRGHLRPRSPSSSSWPAGGRPRRRAAASPTAWALVDRTTGETFG